MDEKKCSKDLEVNSGGRAGKRTAKRGGYSRIHISSTLGKDGSTVVRKMAEF